MALCRSADMDAARLGLQVRSLRQLVREHLPSPVPASRCSTCTVAHLNEPTCQPTSLFSSPRWYCAACPQGPRQSKRHEGRQAVAKHGCLATPSSPLSPLHLQVDGIDALESIQFGAAPPELQRMAAALVDKYWGEEKEE